jgi:hypothetical protein
MYDLKDFEKFVSRYQQIETLARKFKTDPAGMLDVFTLIGSEVLNRSMDPLINDAKLKLRSFMTKYNIYDFDTLLEFLKNANKETNHD